MKNTNARTLFLATSLIGLSLAGGLASPARGQDHIVMWDYGLQGYGALTPTDKDFTQLAAGDEFSMALRSDGSIEVWGTDHWQQITNAPTGSGYVQIAAHVSGCLALHANGTLVSWGELGFNPPPGSNFTRIAVGHDYAVALRANGSVITWGVDNHGQVTNSPTGTDFVDVASSLITCVGLRSDGSLHSWGSDWFGQVSNTPGGTGFVAIEGGSRHFLAMRSDGSIVAWGSNSDGQVTGTPAGVGYLQVTAAGNTSMALRLDGSIETWGAYDTSSQPPFLPSGNGYSAIEAGGSHTLALRPQNTGTPFCYTGPFFTNVCPCQMVTEPEAGCPNSAGPGGAKLVGTGEAVISADTFGLTVSGLPHNGFGLMLVGSDFHNGALGLPFGAGMRCVGGQVAYSQVHRQTGGVTFYSDFHGGSFGSASYGVGVRTNYQFWYRDVNGTCGGSGFNLSNAWSTIWR